MKRRRKILVWILGVIVVLIAVVVLFLALFNWNRVKPTINTRVSQAIGRPFAIHGDLDVHWTTDRKHGDWLPGPIFVANDVDVANPDWAHDKKFAHLDQIRFRLSLWPLLSHRITVRSLQLRKPVIHLEKQGDKRNNWTFDTGPKSEKPSPWTLELREIAFDTGKLTLRDPTDHLRMDVDIDPLDKPIPFADLMTKAAASKADKAVAKKSTQPYAFGFKLTGSYNGAPVRGSGKTGGVLAVRSADMAFPLQADMHIGDVHIALTGSMINPVRLGSIDLHLRVSASSMAHLYPLIGVNLPVTPPFHTDGHLSGQFEPSASRFTYRDFNGQVGGSDLHGTLTWAQHSERPKLSGKVWSNKLQLADLGPLIGLDMQADPSAKVSSKAAKKEDKKPEPGAKVLPSDPFDTNRWDAMDADVAFSGKQILHGKKLPISDLQGHLKMDHGRLALTPLDFGVAGGNVTSSIYLDGRAKPMKGRIHMRVHNLQLKQMFPDVKSMRNALGQINGDIALTATGDSVAALLAASNGEVKLLMEDGAISSELMELAGLNVGNYLVDKMFGSKPVKITCAATDFVDRDGLMTARLAVFDTTDALVRIKGNVNFANEKLDLDIIPHTKNVRIFTLRSPLYVKGTFADPDVGVHVGKLLLRGGAAVALGTVAAPAAALLALIAPSKDKDTHPCAQVLSQARGKAEAPPAGQTKKH